MAVTQPDTVGEVLGDCEALRLGVTVPESQPEDEGLGVSVADPHAVPEADTLLLGEMVPLTVLQVVGDCEPEDVVDSEAHDVTVTDTVPETLTDTLLLWLTEGDGDPLLVASREPVAQGDGLCDTLLEGD